MKIDHWMMFGTFAEQRHFIYPSKASYSGAVINGNMAAHAPAGLAAFLLEKTNRLKYVIDPLTHAFQHDPDVITGTDGSPKSSIVNMASAYGDPLSGMVGKRPLLPKDFSNEEVLEGFVHRCCEFQRRHLTEAMLESDVMKYLDVKPEDLEPYAVIAPYFYMSETTIHKWLPICLDAARRARTQYRDRLVFGAIVISQDLLLSEDNRDELIREYCGIGLDGFFLWVDSLDEQSAGILELTGLLKLARGLRNGGKSEVINLHGGYFSVLCAGSLGEMAMTGVTHGPEFGEHRSVIPVGGGIPIARYYLPHLHARIRYRDVVRFLNEKGWLDSDEVFYRNVCACRECRHTVKNDISNFTEFGKGQVKNIQRGAKNFIRIEYPSMETKLHCLRHYLQRKGREYYASANWPGPELIRNLREGYDTFADIIGLEGVAHLKVWESVLISK